MNNFIWIWVYRSKKKKKKKYIYFRQNTYSSKVLETIHLNIINNNKEKYI